MVALAWWPRGVAGREVIETGNEVGDVAVARGVAWAVVCGVAGAVVACPTGAVLADGVAFAPGVATSGTGPVVGAATSAVPPHAATMNSAPATRASPRLWLT